MIGILIHWNERDSYFLDQVHCKSMNLFAREFRIRSKGRWRVRFESENLGSRIPSQEYVLAVLDEYVLRRRTLTKWSSVISGRRKSKHTFIVAVVTC